MQGRVCGVCVDVDAEWVWRPLSATDSLHFGTDADADESVHRNLIKSPGHSIEGIKMRTSYFQKVTHLGQKDCIKF